MLDALRIWSSVETLNTSMSLHGRGHSAGRGRITGKGGMIISVSGMSNPENASIPSATIFITWRPSPFRQTAKRCSYTMRNAVVLWDLQSKRSLNVWADFVYGWDEQLSPDGRTFVSVSRYFIKTWDVPSGKCAHSLPRRVTFFANSPSLPTAKKSLSVETLGSKSVIPTQVLLKTDFSITLDILTLP